MAARDGQDGSAPEVEKRMTPSLVQISWRGARINRVPYGEMPVVELELDENQEIARFEIREINPFDTDRKTVDWFWSAWVATRL